MDKFIKQKEPKYKEIILDQEHIFKLKVKAELGNEYKIIKSRWVYSPIDFIIVNRLNLKILYIEIKKRSQNKYKSVIINYSKLTNMNSNFQNTLMIFEYDTIYKYVKYNDSMLELPTKNIKQQDVVFFDNSILTNGTIEELCGFIKKELK